MVSALSWAVLALLYQTGSALPDVECRSGESSTVRQLNEGDSFIFKTYGKKYAPNLNCSTDVEMASCTEAVVNCQPFNVLGNKRCTRGDVLNVESLGSKTKKFCGKKGPKNLQMDANFTMNFISDNKGSGSGFKCLVSCNKEDDLLKKIEDLQKDHTDHIKRTEDLEDELNKPRALLCGYATAERGIGATAVLTFDTVVDELSSGVSQGVLNQGTGLFVATVPGTYLITMTASVVMGSGHGLTGEIVSTSVINGGTQIFNVGKASGGTVRTQPAASRYVRMNPGETLYINLKIYGSVALSDVTVCFHLVDA